MEIRICVDYQYINKASPKDLFKIFIYSSIIVQNMSCNHLSIACRILMDEIDEEKTSFVT